MAGATSPQLQANGWFPSGLYWAEYNPRTSPMAGDVAMSYSGGNQATMTILIYPPDVYQAIGDLLGSNIFNQQTGQLDRVPPMKHPVFEWLYASRVVSIKGYVPTTKGTWPGSVSNVTTTVPQFLMLTVLFQQPMFRMLTDAQIDAFGPDPSGLRQEFLRYLEGWPTPKTDFIVVEGQTLAFLETGSGTSSITGNPTGTPGPGAGSTFPSPWPELLNKYDMALVWKRVPAVGLLDTGGVGAALNLHLALQTVNKFTIFGSAPGTLKFEGYKLVPIESPLPPENQNFQGAVGLANLCFDVQLFWSFFDPPYDLTANGGNPTRGHNLGPFRGQPAGTGNFNNLWYKIGAAAGDPLLFPTSDHSKIFHMTT